MAQKTKEQLQTAIKAIRDASNLGENSATRVGTTLENMKDSFLHRSEDAAAIKAVYESNADTNPFTDTDKAALESSSKRAVASVRGAITEVIADLSSFTVAQSDVTYLEADELVYAPSGGSPAAGVYEVGAVSGGTAALTRRADLDAASDFVSGLTIPIREGAHAGKVAVFATTGAITLGVTPLEFVIAEGGGDVLLEDADGDSLTLASGEQLVYGGSFTCVRDGATNKIHLRRRDVACITDYPFNAVASNQSTYCAMTSGSAVATLNNAQDFRNRHGVVVLGAGAVPTLTVPPTPEYSLVKYAVGGPVAGTGGSTQREYQLVAVSSKLGHTTVGGTLSVSDAPDYFADGTAVDIRADVLCTASGGSLSAYNRSNANGDWINNGDRVLLINRTDPAENGLYTASNVSDSTVSLARHTDMNAASEFGRKRIRIMRGTYAATYWRVRDAITTLGTDAVNIDEETAVEVRLPIVTCRVATTGPVNLSAPGSNVFDGVTLDSGVDVVLVKDQADPAENGPYLFNGSGSAMTRLTGYTTAGAFVRGLVARIRSGTTHKKTYWTMHEDTVSTLGTDPINWREEDVRFFLVYARTGGSGTFTLAGAFQAKPLWLSDVSPSTVGFRDYGEVVNGPPLGWQNTNAPSAGRSDFLRARIVSGGGTTTLTLDTAASTTVAANPGRMYHDNWQAFEDAQNSFSDASSSVGGEIFIPNAPATNTYYHVWGELRWRKQVVVRGASILGSVVKMAPSYNWKVQGAGNSAEGTSAERSLFERFTIEGDDNEVVPECSGFVDQDNWREGCMFHVAARCGTQHLEIKRLRGTAHAIMGRDVDNSNANVSWAFDVYAQSPKNGHGFYAAGNESNALLWLACSAVGAGGHGMWDTSFLGGTMMSCHTSANRLRPYYADSGSQRTVWLGCYSESGQAESRMSSAGICIGGTHGSGVFATQGWFLKDRDSVGPFKVQTGPKSARVEMWVGDPTGGSELLHFTSLDANDRKLDTGLYRTTEGPEWYTHAAATYKGTKQLAGSELGTGLEYKQRGGIVGRSGFEARVGVTCASGALTEGGEYRPGCEIRDTVTGAVYTARRRFGVGVTWTASAGRRRGDVVLPTVANGCAYVVSGISGNNITATNGASEPTWPTTENTTVVNGNITFRCLGSDSDAVALAVLHDPLRIGDDLTDADVTITVAQGNRRKLPASTLTANRVLALDTTGAIHGHRQTIVREDTEAFTYEVRDATTGGTLLHTFASATAGRAAFVFNAEAGAWEAE